MVLNINPNININIISFVVTTCISWLWLTVAPNTHSLNGCIVIDSLVCGLSHALVWFPCLLRNNLLVLLLIIDFDLLSSP
jgi:hypothetical protein